MNWRKILCVWLVPVLVLCALPVPACGAVDDEESSDGAVITLGLFGVVLVVLFVVSLVTDVDNVFGRKTVEPPAICAAVREAPVTAAFDDLRVRRETPASRIELAQGAGVGLRVRF
jgi:hypothetical protein